MLALFYAKTCSAIFLSKYYSVKIKFCIMPEFPETSDLSHTIL